MRGKILLAGLVLTLSGSMAMAQEQAQAQVQVQDQSQGEDQAQGRVPIDNDLYCSGLVTSQSVPRDAYVISGEDSGYQITFDQGDYVYIDRGTSQGVKVGDEFFVVRPEVDPIDYQWTKWQYQILHKMGTMWDDEGRVKVVVAEPNTSIAQVMHTCSLIQRGDYLLPFAERIPPPLKSEDNFDRFAAPSGKAKAMIIVGKGFRQELGTNDIAYVNLGNSQGVRVGDYFRVFRYTGTDHDTVYQTPRFAFDVEGEWGHTFGFGSAPRKWDWSNTPREVLGEGIVLRTGPNSSTVLLTFTLREVFAGDYVEIE